jgi:hypothetical protein
MFFEKLPPIPHGALEPSSRWDDGDHAVKVVRRLDGTVFLVRVRTPHPWVLRKHFLSTGDVD